MERIWSTELAAHVGARRPHGRLAAPPTTAVAGDVPVAARRRRHRPGRRRVRRRAGPAWPPSTLSRCSRCGGRVVASEQAPGGVELHDPDDRRAVGGRGGATVRAAPPRAVRRSCRRCSTMRPCRCATPDGGPPPASPRRRSHGFRTALDARRFVEIHTPKVVASATEGGANVFPIDWFGRTAFLAQSPQFYKQTMVGVFERVYEVAPVFRAEPHDTARHLAEYVSLDAEIGVHHRPHRRDGGAAGRHRRDGRRDRRPRRRRRRPARAAAPDRARHHPVDPLRRRPAADRGGDRRARRRRARPGARATSAGSASGRAASTARTSCS